MSKSEKKKSNDSPKTFSEYLTLKYFEENFQEMKRLSWDEMFMEIAKVVAKRSKDPHTQVGAVIVKDGRILGIGYNAEPKNFTYEFDWHSEEKYKYVIHAEMNAIANSTYFGNSINGAKIYLTLSPCHDCVKMLVQFGITEVIFEKKYKDFEEAEMIAKTAGLKLIEKKF